MSLINFLTRRAGVVPALWGVVRSLISHIPPLQTFSWFTKEGESGFWLLVRRHEAPECFGKGERKVICFLYDIQYVGG